MLLVLDLGGSKGDLTFFAGGFMMKSKSHFNPLSVDLCWTYMFLWCLHSSFVV